MDRSFLLVQARLEAGLTQVELAALAGTSQATLSAYERGLKSPSLRVAARILAAIDREFTLRTRVDWVEHHPEGIVAFWVPSRLWPVEPPICFATLYFPDLIHSTEQSNWNLRTRDARRRAYELLIRRGLPQQMIRWLDGGFLIDLWDELDLPDPVREAWAPAVELATRPIEAHTLNFFRWEDPEVAPNARVRGYRPLPKSPPPLPRDSRFDPRP